MKKSKSFMEIKPDKLKGKALDKWCKEIKAKRKKIPMCCKRLEKSRKRDRISYGCSYCDGYSLSYSVGMILANALYTYAADARKSILRDDWDTIVKHADAIMAYAEADSFDYLVDDRKRNFAFIKKQHDFEDAMTWVTREWNSLWW